MKLGDLKTFSCFTCELEKTKGLILQKGNTWTYKFGFEDEKLLCQCLTNGIHYGLDLDTEVERWVPPTKEETLAKQYSQWVYEI